jgi:cell division protein FtsW (lipid II flippase)
MAQQVYYVPPSTVLVNTIVFAILSLLPLAETLALIRVPRIAEQRHWRSWLSIIPLLIAIACLACVVALFVTYIQLAQDRNYTPEAITCNTIPCGPPALSSQTLRAFETAQTLVSPLLALIFVLADFGTAVLGFIVLAIGRRKRSIAPAPGAPSDSPVIAGESEQTNPA